MLEDVFDRLAPQICDSHVHVGKWSDGFHFTPADVSNNLSKLGLRKWAVSSTSTVDEDYEQVKSEFNALLVSSPEQVVPLLWVTPEMVNRSEDFSLYSDIPFRGFKIHRYANEWDLTGRQIKTLMGAARLKRIPVLIHTGWTPESEAGNFGGICNEFEDVRIILAHGRPLDQTIKVMGDNANIYVDTAYMTEEDIGELSQTLGNDRILFGTDFPLDEYFYPDESIMERYKKRVNTLVAMFGEDVFLTWANRNFDKVFGV